MVIDNSDQVEVEEVVGGVVAVQVAVQVEAADQASHMAIRHTQPTIHTRIMGQALGLTVTQKMPNVWLKQKRESGIRTSLSHVWSL